MKKYKNFIITLSSYACDKNCPYCIAKMNKLDFKPEKLDSLKEDVFRLKDEGHAFKSCVLSGNGEPSLYEVEFLKTVKNIMEEADIFKTKRIQTSGNLFFDDTKFGLFKDWLIEVTRVARDYEKDCKILKYNRDYMTTENFKNAKIRMNMVLLKDNTKQIVDDINHYLTYENITDIAIKFLDKSINEKLTKQDKWIIENGAEYTEAEAIIKKLSENFQYLGHEFQNHIWDASGKKISMYVNENYNTDKVDENFMWYADKQLSLEG
jgi:organic radical activating enzyme